MGVFDFFKNPNGNDLQAVVSPEKKKKNFLEQFLPEDEDKRRALARSMMMGGASMLANGGPSSKPTNFLSVLGHGIGAGVDSYDDSLKTDAEVLKANQAAKANQVKLQMAQSNQDAVSALNIDPTGNSAMSIEQLKGLYKLYLQNGEFSAANSLMERIQRLDDEQRKDGAVLGPNGYELAPGVAQTAERLSRAKDAGEFTTDRKDYMFGAENPEFRKYETDKAKSNSTNVNVNTAPKDGKIFEELTKEREKAAGSQNGLRLVYEMKQALPNAILGFGSDYLLYGQKAIAALGGDASRVVDTESLKVNAMELAASMKGELVGNQQISDSDMKFVQAVAAGDTSLDGGTIKRLVDIREKQLTGNIERYNSRINEIYPDNAENKTSRNYFGGISVPENPYTKKAATSPTSDSSAKTSRAGGVTVVSSEAEFNALPPGSSFRFADEETVRVKR